MADRTKCIKYGSLQTKITSRTVLWCLQNFSAVCGERKNIRSDYFKVSTLPNCLFYLALTFEAGTNSLTLYVYRSSHNNFTMKPSCFAADVTISFEDLFNTLHLTKSYSMTQDISFISSSYNPNNIAIFCVKGNLHIHCSVTLMETELSASQRVYERIKNKIWSHCSVISSNEIKEHVAVLLEGDSSNRVIIVVDGEEFPVHKNMLCSHSPVFSAMFSHETLESKQNCVYVNDICKEVIGEMIKFIYTGCTSALSPLMNMELYAAADKYAISGLKTRCSNFLASALNQDLILDVLVLAHHHADSELRNTCIQFLIEKASNLLESEEFLSFIENECEIIQSILLFVVKQNVK